MMKLEEDDAKLAWIVVVTTTHMQMDGGNLLHKRATS
jgi:hypothetical protein